MTQVLGELTAGIAQTIGSALRRRWKVNVNVILRSTEEREGFNLNLFHSKDWLWLSCNHHPDILMMVTMMKSIYGTSNLTLNSLPYNSLFVTMMMISLAFVYLMGWEWRSEAVSRIILFFRQRKPKRFSLLTHSFTNLLSSTTLSSFLCWPEVEYSLLMLRLCIKLDHTNCETH